MIILVFTYTCYIKTDRANPCLGAHGPRTIKIGPSNPQKVGCIQMSVQIIAFASEPISAKLLILLT